VNINLDLSVKEKVYLLVAKLPGKFSKFCPSYLRELSNSIGRIKKLGGELIYKSRAIQVLYEGSNYKLRLGTTDFLVFDQVILDKEYEPIVSLIKRGNFENSPFNIIDAGANIGLASVFFCRNFANTRVLAIEPDLENFKALKHNMDLNGLTKNVTPIHAGIWGNTRKLNLSHAFRDGREWSLNLEEANNADEGSIDAYSLEDLMQKYSFETIDFLKIDIEGGEKNLFDVWENDSSVLSKVRYLALEIHDEIVDRKFIQGILIKAGFELTEINETTFCVNVRYK